MAHPLDRPVWNMLTSCQRPLAVIEGAAVRIDPRYGPFAAAADGGAAAQAALAATLRSGADEIWVVEPEEWPAPPGTRVVRTAPLAQMLAEHPAPLQPGDDAAVILGEGDAAHMREIAAATQPGPWGELTHRYGTFYGLHHDGALQAMAGERMRPATGLAEVSGVCTWPQWRGQGCAARLIRRVMAGFTARGDLPFLHSYAGNSGAIGLYRTLGFEVRSAMVLTVLARA